MSSIVSKKTKMSDLIHLRIKVITLDGRQFLGKLLSFDKHMNLVISECEEFRITRKSQQSLLKQTKQANKTVDESKVVEDKRFLGLIILRGEHVISLSVENGVTIGKPVLNNAKLAQHQQPKGTSRVLSSNSNNSRLLSSNRGPGSARPNNGARKFNPPPGFKR